MAAQRNTLMLALTALLAGCVQDSGERAGPEALLASSFAKTAGEQQTVVVNPDANGHGVAATIQEGIDRVAPGGKVLVRPGVYPEAIVIDKGLTLEGIGDGGGPVVIAPEGTPIAAVAVTTSSPVTIRDLFVRFSGPVGIGGDGIVDVTIERATVVAVNPPLGAGNVVIVQNLGNVTGGRARLVVRESFIDGGVAFKNGPSPVFPQMFGIRPSGDVDAVIERNVVRRTGGACIHVVMRGDLGGETNADIVDNDLDECYPLGRAGALLVGTAFGGVPLVGTATATGVVNIVGNTIRNSTGSCILSSGINYEYFTGRIEHNRILGTTLGCAITTLRVMPAGIWVGSIRGLPGATPVVRFNDIVGNAQAGLRIGPNVTATLDASCNWYGSTSGPAGAGPGTGDALVVQAGAATPVFAPFAATPIAGTGATSCD